MAHHEPLKALGPIDWSDVPQDNLKHFLPSTFSQAQTAVDSIPIPPAQNKPALAGRARSHTDSSVFPPFDPTVDRPTSREHANTTAGDSEAAAAAAAQAAKLQKEWKEIKVPPKDNPMGISVYKLSAKDGRGAWFARRSMHNDVPFDKFKLGLEKEFGETLKNSSGPGAGSVRGIGAERRVEHIPCDGVGDTAVWLLSAQFPGPTTPRDFVTLLLSGTKELGRGKGRAPRQFMVVSKPCNHPDTQPRSGFIRGNYESVELIREVPMDRPVRRVRSSVDLRRDEIQLPNQQLGGGQKLDKEAVLRSAAKRATTGSAQDLAQSMSALSRMEEREDSSPETLMAVEWIMLTRSDPGGSVPRFMVEKGTPGGIVSDAGRFLKWLDSKSVQDLEQSDANNIQEDTVEGEEGQEAPLTLKHAKTPSGLLSQQEDSYEAERQEIPPSGLYSMITGVIGAASSAVASRLPAFTNPESDHTIDESDTESEASFASAQEPDEPAPLPPVEKTISQGGDMKSIHSGKSEESTSKVSQHEKQLKKLQDRYKKIEEKMTRQQERSLQGKQSQGDDGLVKLKEKHEKEIARQEENYRKEIRKLEEKRLKEEKKAEERRRKEAEKEAKNNVAMELERTRVERDMAFKQIDILKEQVGDLQAQNTKLVAQLGKLNALGKTDELVGNGAT